MQNGGIFYTTPSVFAGFSSFNTLQVSHLLFHSVIKALETVEDPVQEILEG